MTTLDNWLADRALKITETERRDLGFAPHQILLDEPASAIAAVAALAGVHHWVALNALLPLEDPERERR